MAKHWCVKCSKSFEASEGESAPLMRALGGLFPANPAFGVGFARSGMKCDHCGDWICAECAREVALSAGAGMIQHTGCGGMFAVP